ncbi:MAG: chemotaxis protein CheA [Coriobacteriia bacterium]|nr:chemotaxis protein CheA [Coriobacteriia bacterium]
MARRSAPPTLEQLAETLILTDPHDADALSDLEDIFSRYADWAEGSAAPEIADAAAECAAMARGIREAGTGTNEAIGALGHAFERLQRTALAFGVTSAEADGSPGSDDPRGRDATGRGTKPAATSSVPSESVATSGPDDPGCESSIVEDRSLIADFVTRAGELLDGADESLVVLEREPRRRDLIDDVFRAFHTLKGMAGFLALDHIQETAHAAESVLDAPRHGEGALASQDCGTLFDAVDEMRRQVAGVMSQGGPPSANSESPEPASAAAATVEARPAIDSSADPSRGHVDVMRPTIRVDEGRLDRLLDAIGEMVIAESMASESARADAVLSERLAQQLGRLDKITRELQELATSLRMMPLSATFRRMGRLVRDLAYKSGKQVELLVAGEDTELDKEMVDRINDPLIHLLRNAIDHGIEPPDARVAAGKHAVGLVHLRAFHEGGAVVIQVIDDGRGLDVAAIEAKARELDLIDPNTALEERDALALILAPGFSTAREVTDVSGRGVGMDVVKRAVEDLRGQIEVETTPGKGTCFTVRLPLTLAIIDGMVVRVGEERYIIPTASIQRSVRPDPSTVTSVLNRGSVLADGDGFIPLMHLGAIFGTPGSEPDPSRGIVVVCEAGTRRVGLVACEILGQQQTVIKGLGEDLRGAAGLAGGAIMSDGRVGLILDVVGLVAQANAGGGE